VSDRPLSGVPSLDALAARPDLVAGLRPDAVATLLGRALVAQSALFGRLLVLQAAPAPVPAAPPAGWLTPAEVAKRLGVNTGYVLELCRRGVLPSQKLGKYRRIPEDGLSTWQAEQCRGGVDDIGSETLPSARVPGRGTLCAQTPRAVAVAIRRVARRTPGDGEEMGDGGAGHARAGRAANPPARGAAPPGTA
jgi:excisionase family DNA binding protein